jgi:hypothetical protein
VGTGRKGADEFDRVVAEVGDSSRCAAVGPLAPRGDFGGPPKSYGRGAGRTGIARSTLHARRDICKGSSLGRKFVVAGCDNPACGTRGPRYPDLPLRHHLSARSARVSGSPERHLPPPAPQPPPRRDAENTRAGRPRSPSARDGFWLLYDDGGGGEQAGLAWGGVSGIVCGIWFLTRTFYALKGVLRLARWSALVLRAACLCRCRCCRWVLLGS